MKLFISYGHDANQDFVRIVKADLEHHGHSCWIDSERIHEQPDWRRSLTDALHDCDWTVGFLSRHAMRPGGVTAQELAIAQEQRGGCLTTVLLEKQDGWQVPVAVGHAQWVDMSDWAARKAEGETVFAAWYAEKFAELLDRLRPELAERYAAEIEKLETWLDPAPQLADIKRHLDGFVGREWLADIVDKWRLDRPDAKLFWLTGQPGSGKSAFAAWLTAQHRANVVALNLCSYNLSDRCDPARIALSLAFAAARRVQDYRAQLLRLMPQIDAQKISMLDAATLFDRLLIQPLAHCFDGGRTGDRLLLVIDGLDEAVANASGAGLVSLLRQQGELLPDWVGLVVTSRPEQPAKSAFAGLPSVRIDAEGEQNDEDLAVYVRGWLGGKRSEAELATLIPAIVQRAESSFIYVRMLREAYENRGAPLDKDHLPAGLGGLYAEWFARQFRDPEAYETRVAPLLALLVAARTPVPDAVLDAAMTAHLGAWTPRTAARTLESLGSLFERRGDGWAPFHKSLRDWLTDREETPAQWFVDAASGRLALAAAVWQRLREHSRTPEPMPEPFALRELPAFASAQPAAVRAKWASEADHALLACCALAVTAMRERKAWRDALAWCDLVDLLDEMGVGDGRRWAAIERGDVFRLLGDSGRAIAAYRAGVTVVERLAASAPDNAHWQRALFVSHDKIGNVLLARGDRAAALIAYRAGMAIAERLAASDPENAVSQRDLSISHNTIGNVLIAQGDRAAALIAYRASMTIRERLAASDPDNAEWQRDLSISHTKIGNVLVALGDRAAALTAYRAGLAIAERLAASDPDNADWQRDLSASHNNIGDLLAAQGDQAAALTAYRADMAIAERLAASDPDNADWQIDLFVTLFKLVTTLSEPVANDEACRMAKRLVEQADLLATRFPQDPQRDDYVRQAAEWLDRACGPAVAP